MDNVSLEKIQQFFLGTEAGQALRKEEQRQELRHTLVAEIAALQEREAQELPAAKAKE